jgi:hypothetical protein
MTGKVDGWYVRRTAEMLLFAVVVFIDSWRNAENFVSTLPLVAIAIFTYGVWLLYVPLSGLTWLFGWRRNFHAKALTDSLLFFAHGWAAISLMYNGPWLITRPLDLGNSLIVGWLAVGGLHLILLTLSIFRARRRRV